MKFDVAKLVEDYYQPLFRYAFRLSGSANDAEDLTQETFCQAQRKLAQLRDGDRVRGWLFSILRNAYLHRLRSEKVEKTVPLDAAGELVGKAYPDLPEVDPELLQAALNELPEVFRTPVILYYFDDFSYREIAEQMELPIGTVMSRLSRARCFLRGRLLSSPTRKGES
jgi:RNA polymerase sigma-70 factor (ECF subfamily)